MLEVPPVGGNMTEPSQGQVSKPARRKTSFEEYQRRLVDKIKRHFERRRRQWEKNIESQLKCRSSPGQELEEEEEDEEGLESSTDDTPYQKTPAINRTNSVTSLGDSPSDATQHSHPAKRSAKTGFTCYAATSEIENDANQIKIISVENTDFPDECKTKHTILVNIQSFLPFGSVTVRQVEKGLMLIGESNSRCNCRSRSRRQTANTCEKLVELHATVENDSMVVHTTREGVMRIEVVTELPELIS